LILYSLVLRRKRGDLIEVFKILNNLENMIKKSYSIDLQQQICADMIVSCSKVIPRSCVAETFSQRVINNWNSLPQHVVDLISLNVFQKRLDHHIDTSDCEDMGNKS